MLAKLNDVIDRGSRSLAVAALLIGAASAPAPVAAGDDPRPNIVIVSIDTLRADRLSAYGYGRPTSPNLDRAIAAGVRFSEARTVEPLTCPALCSMVTSLYPHEHGSSRNGLKMRPGLPSLPKLLQQAGYRTAAFVGNWTLRDKISGLAEHFSDYNEVLTRKRWMGLVNGEATAKELTSRSLAWLEQHLDTRGDEPFMLWVHYTDPHAPYKLHEQYVETLGIGEVKKKGKAGAPDRYDTEIAFVDDSVGDLLAGLARRVRAEDTLLILTSDHGESLGEHDYWGHGRHLYEPTLRIPMAVVWSGRLESRTIDAPALNIDLAPTIATLLNLEAPSEFKGYDWAPVFAGAEPPHDRVTQYQAHRGAVLTVHDSELARRSGLLAVAVLHRRQKEIFRVKNDHHCRFDLRVDPRELTDLTGPENVEPTPTGALQNWMSLVSNGLEALDDAPPQPLDGETIERLRALGYAD